MDKVTESTQEVGSTAGSGPLTQAFTVDAAKVRLGGFAPTLPMADTAKVRLGGFAPTLPTRH